AARRGEGVDGAVADQKKLEVLVGPAAMRHQAIAQRLDVFVEQRIVEEQAGLPERAEQLATVAAQLLRRRQRFRRRAKVGQGEVLGRERWRGQPGHAAYNER